MKLLSAVWMQCYINLCKSILEFCLQICTFHITPRLSGLHRQYYMEQMRVVCLGKGSQRLPDELFLLFVVWNHNQVHDTVVAASALLWAYRDSWVLTLFQFTLHHVGTNDSK